jgi:hypothetical protein
MEHLLTKPSLQTLVPRAKNSPLGILIGVPMNFFGWGEAEIESNYYSVFIG